MKKLKVIFAFIISFFIFFMLLFPYKDGYSYLINKISAENKLHIDYKILRASPFGITIKKVKIYSKPVIKIAKIKISLNPLGFIFNSNLATVNLTIKGKKATFSVKENNGKYTINGVFKTSMLSEFVGSKLSSFIENFKGEERIIAILTPSKNNIKIDELKAFGDFELTAKGFIIGKNVRLMGVIKIGKIKESFSF